MIKGYYFVIINIGRSTKACPLRSRIDGQGKVLPMDEVLADGMAPMLTGEFRRIGLVEQVPVALPETEPIGVIQAAFRIYIMINGPVRII